MLNDHEQAVPMGVTWLGCSLISSAGRTTPDLSSDLLNRLQHYQLEFPEAESLPIWHDRLCDRLFSGAEIRGPAAGGEFHFNDERDGFLVRKWGTMFVRRSIRGLPGFERLPIFTSREAVYGAASSLKAVRGRSVLIVLGGPSTNEVQWHRVRADCLWSCNRFYEHPRLRNTPLDLVALAPNVPLNNNKALERYVSRYNPVLLFELQKVSDIGARDAMRATVCRWPERCTYLHLRYASYLGLGARMILFAVLLKAREVFFVGFDGMSATGPRHAFEPGKSSPAWYKRFGDDVQRRQLVVFWEYVLSLAAKSKTCLYNLSEAAAEENHSVAIARASFSLPRRIRALVAARSRLRPTTEFLL